MQQEIVLSLVLLSLAVAQCQRLFNVAPRFPPCDGTIWSQANINAQGASCSGLTELLAVVNSSVQTGDEVVINLERVSDHHYLTDTVHITANASITIRGVCRPGVDDCDKSTIVCDIANISDDYSMRFEHNYAVTLQGIEFIGCPRILIIIEVFNVSVTECMFRLVVGMSLINVMPHPSQDKWGFDTFLVKSPACVGSMYRFSNLSPLIDDLSTYKVTVFTSAMAVVNSPRGGSNPPLQRFFSDKMKVMHD